MHRSLTPHRLTPFRLKVCHLITRLDRGGSAAAVLDLCGALAGEGHAVTLAAGRSDESDEALRRLPSAVRLLILDDLVRDPAPIPDLRALAWLIGFFRRESFDVIHTHTSKAGFLGRLAARLAQIQYPMPDPKVVHQPHGHLFYGYYGRVGSAAVRLAERLAARWTDRFVALTERGVQEHVERGVGRREMWTAIPPAVVARPLVGSGNAAPYSRAEAQSKLIVFVGRLEHVKGPDLALEALAFIAKAEPAARLVFAGEGSLREPLERRVTALGLTDRVEFLGHVSDPAPRLAEAAVVIVPSRNEGFGHALLEAMAAGRPVVAAAVGGVPDLLRDGSNGLLVPPEDPDALARAVLRILREPEFGARLGREAEKVRGHYTLDATVRAVLGLYQEIDGAGLKAPPIREG